MNKIWRIKKSNPQARQDISSALKISEVTAQLLFNRGVEDPAAGAEFLKCSISSCHDPLLLKDMDKAVCRIRKAISEGENILVYGDYDVDGMTAVAILYTALKNIGARVESYIPNRVEEGYGLNMAAIKKAKHRGVSLIVTVDCGISSFKEVEYARSLKIDIIVTDHHEVIEKVPNAYAVINPLRPDCSYPFKHLAGVGLAYKLVKALYGRTKFFAEDFLDLVSLGTVADIAPLVGENRILTKHGLGDLSRRGRVGLKALMDVAGLGTRDITSGHIGYMLGPRINAMGRIGSPEKALELLLSTDELSASSLAKALDTENRNRQKIEAGILEEALAKVEREVNFKHHKVIVLASEGWHPGVIGIVASRIADRFYRPTILISLDGKVGKGSGRSIEGFHLFSHLAECRDCLIGFGGHESACGVTIEKDMIDKFRKRINEAAGGNADEKAFIPKLDIDMDAPISLINEDVINEIDCLAPFGRGNPRPVLASCGLLVKDGPRNIGRNGFKLWVTDGLRTCEAVSFGKSGMNPPGPGSRVDLVYTPSINDWQGLRSIQLELRDIRQG